VLPTKESESGLWATPNTMDHLPPRSKEGTMKLMQGHRKGRTKPSNLREQVDPETMRLWRTPDAHCDRGASSEKRMKMKIEKKMPISLNDQVAHPNIMWPTPRASAAMAENSNQVKKRVDRRGRLGSKLEESIAMNQTGTGGSLNPMWVEWLMGFPIGWTDLKD
jgi:DNA (cytosine-5)-methyltransferase 1